MIYRREGGEVCLKKMNMFKNLFSQMDFVVYCLHYFTIKLL